MGQGLRIEKVKHHWRPIGDALRHRTAMFKLKAPRDIHLTR